METEQNLNMDVYILYCGFSQVHVYSKVVGTQNVLVFQIEGSQNFVGA